MTAKTFLHDLRRGLGSAIIELQTNPDREQYRNMVLRCCLRDISHDWQVEGTKGYYLFSAICSSGARIYFERIIIERFLSRCGDRLFRQLADILSCCASDSRTLAKDALHVKYEYFLTKKGRLVKGRIDEGFQWEDVACRLFTIDGFSAFKRYAVDMGELLKKNPNSSDVLYYDWFITEAEDTFGKKRTRAYIDKMYEKLDAIKTLMDTIKTDELSRKQYQENHQEERVTVETLVQAAREMAVGEISHYGPVMRLRRPFMKDASEADVLELARTALREKDETVKGLLLRIFGGSVVWSKPFPLGAAPLLEYARSSNRILYENALGFLEEFKDKRIHDLAVQLLTTHRLKSLALGLLKKYYRKSDDPIIAKAINKASSIPQHIQRDIADIAQVHPAGGADAAGTGDCAADRTAGRGSHRNHRSRVYMRGAKPPGAGDRRRTGQIIRFHRLRIGE